MEPSLVDFYELAENVSGIVYSFCLVIVFVVAYGFGRGR